MLSQSWAPMDRLSPRSKREAPRWLGGAGSSPVLPAHLAPLTPTQLRRSPSPEPCRPRPVSHAVPSPEPLSTVGPTGRGPALHMEWVQG